jgi:hypothetical protein
MFKKVSYLDCSKFPRVMIEALRKDPTGALDLIFLFRRILNFFLEGMFLLLFPPPRWN